MLASATHRSNWRRRSARKIVQSVPAKLPRPPVRAAGIDCASAISHATLQPRLWDLLVGVIKR
jgi:hypothetical protein